MIFVLIQISYFSGETRKERRVEKTWCFTYLVFSCFNAFWCYDMWTFNEYMMTMTMEKNWKWEMKHKSTGMLLGVVHSNAQRVARVCLEYAAAASSFLWTRRTLAANHWLLRHQLLLWRHVPLDQSAPGHRPTLAADWSATLAFNLSPRTNSSNHEIICL